MSFSRAPIRRFNEVQPNSPPVGSYDPKFEGTIPIPYPKGDSAFLMRRDSNWRGSTQSLYSLNSERLSSRSSCYSVASERIATRLHSTGCLGVTRGGRRRVWTGMDGGMESGRTGWWGNVAGKTVSEACVKRSVKANVGGRGGELAKGKLKDQESKGQGKYKANVEDSSEAKTKSRIPQLDGRLSGRPKTEAKCEDSREACGKVDRKASYEVDAKAHCQATGETIAFHKGTSQKALSASRAAEYGKDQLETPSQESVVEWPLEEQTVFRKNQRPRSERRRFQLIRPKPGNARVVEENGLQWKKQIQESNQERPKQRPGGGFPKGNDSSLLIDAMERVSRAEEEVEALRTRVDELERENAGLEQARVLTERDLMDEVDWRTEELGKMEAVVEKVRASKRRVKQELKSSQAMQENLRLENLKKTEELESTRASVTGLRTEAQRNAEELERALQLVEKLRLENSKKAEELENSQLYARHLQSEYVTLSKTLEKSQSLVENLSTEIMAKATELERSLAVIRNLQSENNAKTSSLEDSWAAIETLQEENLRCKEALRHRQSHVPGHLAGGNNSSSKFPQWSRQCPERAFNPGKHQPTFQTKPRRSANDEDFEMTDELQFEPNLNNGRFAIGGEIPGSDSRRGHDREIELLQSTDSWSSLTGFKLVEDQRLQSEVWKSPSKVQDGFKEAKGRQLRSSLSFCATELSDDDQQQKVLVVKSEPILTDELTAICNQIQILSLRRKGTTLNTEERASGSQEEVQGSLVLKESETLKQCEENLGYRELESLRELQGALTNREPVYQEELQRALENLEFRIPQDIELKDEVPRKTGKDPENRDSGELLELLIPQPDQVRIEVRSNQSTSAHDHQNNHTVRLEHSEERLPEEEVKDPDESHANSEDLIAGKAAGDRKTVENCSEKKKCMNAISQLRKTLERNDTRSGTISIKKKVESKGTSTDGLYKLVDVYGERLENYRETFHPRTSESQCELLKKFLEKHPCRTTEKRVEKVGEKSAQNGGEKFGESGGMKSGRKLFGATFERKSEEKHGLKLADRCAEKFGEKFKGNVGLWEEKFGAKSGDVEPTGDANRGEYDTALQWRRRYEDLWSVAQPFKDLLSAFHSQRQMLQGHRNAGKAEIEKLSHEFAKVLNHEHERQRISQMLQLRDQNVTLKKELDMLRTKSATAEVTRR